MKRIFILFLLLFISNSILSQMAEENMGYKNLKISSNGNNLIFSNDEFRGFYLLDLTSKNTILIDNNKFSAYQASFSPDGKFVAYKRFIETENSRLQQPVLFDISSGKTIDLFEPVQRCGTPSFSKIGNIVFTVGKTLYLFNSKGEEQKSVKLHSYSNLTPVSPDGKYVVFNDNKDRLWLFNLTTSEKKLISQPGNGYFEPIWSPNGQKIVASSMSGELNIINKNDASIVQIGKGKHPIWTNDSKKLIYSKAKILENREVVNQHLYVYNILNQNETRLSNSEDREDYPAISGNSIYYSQLNLGKFIKAELIIDNDSFELLNPSEIDIILDSQNTIPENKTYKKKDPLSAVYFDIPYVNQRYDTPDWFNGNWACGATAAIQCISYFGLVKQWPVWASTPFPHISDYGNYICEIYTYNGTTFNIGGRDPNGTMGYGGYGYIIKNNWLNTKDYMRDYAIIHGLSSAVDWDETREKLAIEITNEDPFVLLNSLTTSGHYISVIGYDDIDTTTVIVNDPYGDKNLGYANFYGRRAWYDWPGYNNGYENLNQVHCFIYFRGDPPADIEVQYFTVQIDTAELNQNIFVSTEFSNIGKQPSIASTIEFFLSQDGIYDENANILSTFALPALQVGQTHILQDSITMPDSIISGDYKLSVFADADTINNEMLKDNNVLTTDIVIHGYPRIYAIIPEDNSIITNTKPEIRVKFQDRVLGIDMENIKLFINNIEITDSCSLGTREISYIPNYNLSDGIYFCRTEVPNLSGFTVNYSWSFEIQQVSGINDRLFNPKEFYLSQNYPNPFNPITNITFNLPVAGNVSIEVFDISGNLVSELLKNEFYSSGYHKLSFNAESLASGVYFYKLTSGNKYITKKMLLLR